MRIVQGALNWDALLYHIVLKSRMPTESRLPLEQTPPQGDRKRTAKSSAHWWRRRDSPWSSECRCYGRKEAPSYIHVYIYIHLVYTIATCSTAVTSPARVISPPPYTVRSPLSPLLYRSSAAKQRVSFKCFTLAVQRTRSNAPTHAQQMTQCVSFPLAHPTR